MTKRNVLLGRGVVSLVISSLIMSIGAPFGASAQILRVDDAAGTLQGLRGSLRQMQVQYGLEDIGNFSSLSETPTDSNSGQEGETPVPVDETPTEPAPTPIPAPEVEEEVVPAENEVLAAAGNLIPNPSLEKGSTVPANWQKGSWGTNNAVFKYPAVGYKSSRSAKISLTSYTSGDAKWFFDEVTVEPGATYTFSNYYNSNIPSYITVRYLLSDGSYQYAGLSALPSSINTWKQYVGDITVPVNAQKLTIFHLIQQVGALRVDQFSLAKKSNAAQGMVTLAFDDGWLSAYQNAVPIVEAAGYKSTHYVNSQPWKEDFEGYMQESHILDLQSRGHEVGAHTRTHADLTQLSDAQIRSEVKGNRDDLLALGIKKVDSFAYPYGSYNDQVKQIVKESGFKTARSINEGLNMKGTDSYLLNWQGPENNTSVAQMKQWVDRAINQKGWLIISFHEIINNGGQYSNTPQSLKEVVDYLKLKNVRVVTVSEGAAMLGL